MIGIALAVLMIGYYHLNRCMSGFRTGKACRL